jgi:hypothetical protein
VHKPFFVKKKNNKQMVKTNKYGLIILLIMSIFATLPAFAQISVSAKMDTNMLLIGDQTNITFEATFPDTIMASLPVYSDTVINKLEILNISDIDTVIENNMLKISQKYLVTSFDSGWYVIPPAKFTFGYPKANFIDTVWAKPLYFGVLTMPLDTANPNAITDIKAPIDAPLTFKEVLPFVGGGLGILLLAFLLFVLYKKYVKKEEVFVKKEKPKEPAHIVAIRELDKLKDEKLWQKGLIKKYYSALTDIVRTYMEDRFEFPAMESTTEEIIQTLRKNKEIDKELKNELFEMLRDADFVKFAKATPLAEENEKNLKLAYDFILKTKPVEVLRDEDEDEGEEKE